MSAYLMRRKKLKKMDRIIDAHGAIPFFWLAPLSLRLRRAPHFILDVIERCSDIDHNSFAVRPKDGPSAFVRRRVTWESQFAFKQLFRRHSNRYTVAGCVYSAANVLPSRIAF